jgi:hypothetical protein
MRDKEPTSEVVVREILPQETKYSIAKQYKITVELDRQSGFRAKL